MATYVLIHGAGDVAWSWHLLAAELRDRGHEVVAVDLPCDDDSAGLGAYADTVVEAIGGRTDLIVVAHFFGGFTGPLVCDRIPGGPPGAAPEFVRRMVRERLGITPEEIDGRHGVALSRPRELADALEIRAA